MSDKKIKIKFIEINGYCCGDNIKHPERATIIFKTEELIGWKYTVGSTIKLSLLRGDEGRYSAWDIRSSELEKDAKGEFEGLWVTPDGYRNLQKFLATVPLYIKSFGKEFVE